jgi:hypothetical protein
MGNGLMEKKTLVFRLQELSVSWAARVDTLVALTIHQQCVKKSNNLWDSRHVTLVNLHRPMERSLAMHFFDIE